MDFKIEKVEKYDDKRGKLIILLKKNDLPGKSRTFGEVFYITFSKKGISRANHYHKNWREWFIVVSGKLKVILEDIKTKKQASLILDAKSNHIKRLEVGPFVAHSFINLSKEAILLNYSNKIWQAKDVIHYEISRKKKSSVKKI